ncbi:hypothetical protein [Paraburkholderia sp.]
MITIPAVTDGNGVQSPQTPIPADAIAVVCDGTNYTVYEPGDTVPAQFQS